MKKLFLLTLLTSFLLTVALTVLAQGQVIVPPTGSEWNELLLAIGGVSGAGTMGIVFVIVKALALGLRTQLGKFTGVWQLVIVNGLMFVLGVLGSVMNDVPFVASVLVGSNLALLSLFGNQVIKQISKRGDDAEKIANS